MKFITGLGFSEQMAESMKETLFESDEFDVSLYQIVDGSEYAGKEKVIDVVTKAGEEMLFEAADALEVVLDNLESDGTQ